MRPARRGILGSALVDAIRRLEIIEAIHVLKARYFRCIDTQDWETFASLFVEDFEADVTEDMAFAGLPRDSGIRQGRERWVRGVAKALEGVRSVHHGHMPEIDVIDDTNARGIWAMTDRLEWGDGSVLDGAGHYHEEYVCENGEWKFARLRLSRLRLVRK